MTPLNVPCPCWLSPPIDLVADMKAVKSMKAVKRIGMVKRLTTRRTELSTRILQ
jgi:hypothetical protein